MRTNDNCENSQDPNCFRNSCTTEIEACADCAAGEVEINFGCATPCTDATECGADEECVDPYLGAGEDGQKYCSYSPDNLGGACADNPDCGGPDPSVTEQGGGFCNTNVDGGFCLAVFCNYGLQYGPTTGCGLEAICGGQDDGQGGTIGICQPLCSENTDCLRGDTGEFSCNVVQLDQDGSPLGLCSPSCATDADCQFQDGTQGRCNDNSYCEVPCEGDGADCTDRGGVCTDFDGTEYCVFDAAQ
ncbi:hypothetical protein [Persicimonas caeni]|uniref:hypothetical protein n=1 Tax=Persicimonas caeni TaxID=2292766 RepID=UPI00143E0BE7|nr:hypothetical protein [Persicimonas caeni]